MFAITIRSFGYARQIAGPVTPSWRSLHAIHEIIRPGGRGRTASTTCRSSDLCSPLPYDRSAMPDRSPGQLRHLGGVCMLSMRSSGLAEGGEPRPPLVALPIYVRHYHTIVRLCQTDRRASYAILEEFACYP